MNNAPNHPDDVLSIEQEPPMAGASAVEKITGQLKGAGFDASDLDTEAGRKDIAGKLDEAIDLEAKKLPPGVEIPEEFKGAISSGSHSA